MSDPQQLSLLLDEPRAYRIPFACVGCGVDTSRIGEYYDVHEQVWPLDPQGGMLCIACLETRVGRRLVPADFTGAPINGPDRELSVRLADRLGYARAEARSA